MGRPRNPDALTPAQKSKLYRERHEVRRVGVGKETVADMDKARRPGESDRSVVARGLRLLAEQEENADDDQQDSEVA